MEVNLYDGKDGKTQLALESSAEEILPIWESLTSMTPRLRLECFLGSSELILRFVGSGLDETTDISTSGKPSLLRRLASRFRGKGGR